MVNVTRLKDTINVSSPYFSKEYTFMYTEEKLNTLLAIEARSESIKSKAELEDLISEIEAIASDDTTQRIESIHPNLVQEPITKKYFLKYNGVIDTIAIPDLLVEYIQTTIDKGLDATPIIKLWIRWRRNKKSNNDFSNQQLARYISMKHIDHDKYDSLVEQGYPVDTAKDLATINEIKITKEGLLCVYKSVDEVDHKFVADEDGDPRKVKRYTTKFDENTGEILGDNRDELEIEDRLFIPHIQKYSGDPFRCSGPNGFADLGHFVKVGCEISLESWDQVDTRDNIACVKGLHTGGLSYLEGWGDTTILVCFVDPQYIGAICDYSNFWAMRVLKYFVYGKLDHIGNNIYHSSDYAKKNDAEWQIVLAEIFKDNQKVIDEIKSKEDFLKTL